MEACIVQSMLASDVPLDLEAALASYREHGYARLGAVCPEATRQALAARADDLMLGKVTYPGLFFQLDGPSGRYEDLSYGKGWQGPSLDYRKIEKLEKDPLYLAWIEAPVFEHVARALISGDVVLYRALLMMKGERGGTVLPWHQDGGKMWGLDRDPVMQVWTALDDAPEGGGCIEVVPGSHKGGLASPLGGLVPERAVAEAGADARALALPVRAGESLLLHNHVWHRSLVSRSGHARRALSVCYMSAETRCLRTRRAPRVFPPVFRR